MRTQTLGKEKGVTSTPFVTWKVMCTLGVVLRSVAERKRLILHFINVLCRIIILIIYAQFLKSDSIHQKISLLTNCRKPLLQ